MSSKIIEVLIAQPIPNAPAGLQSDIITAWVQADAMLDDVTFKVEDPFDDKLDVYRLSMDLGQVIEVLEHATEHEGGFTKYRQLMRQGSASINSVTIKIELTVQAAPENTIAYYHAAAVALQQLYLSLNLAVPGSCQMVDAKYPGDESVSFDPPVLEASPFIDAYLNNIDSQWPSLNRLNVADVWNWLKALKTSETETAILPVNKVLFGLLELGQSQAGLTNKDALLVCRLLELLTNTTEVINQSQISARILLILGHVSKDGDAIPELYRLKQAHAAGTRPFHRQVFKIHDFEEELLRHLCVHNSPVEEGLVIILAIVQKLCSSNGVGFDFDETVSMVSR